MKRFFIGIVAKPLLNHQVPNSLWKRLVINDEFRERIVRYGGIPIGIMPDTYYNNRDTAEIIENISDKEKVDIYAACDLVDGIILQGGLTSDTYEIEIVKYAIQNNIPIMGICAGFNNIAKALKIPLYQSGELSLKHNIYGSYKCHTILINKTHKLYQLFDRREIEVNSIHTIFMKNSNLPDNVEVLATDFDGNVEAFTVKDAKLCIGIKWHPELLCSKESENLFRYFLEQCRN